MKPTPRIEKYLAGLAEAKAVSNRIVDAFDSLIDDCNRRISLPIGEDARAHVAACIELAATQKARAEFLEWPLENRIQADALAYLKRVAPEICEVLRADVAECSKSKDNFLAGIGKRVSEISLEMFAPSRNRDKLAAEREKAEQAAENAEYTLAAALTSIRNFELEPNENNFGAACARTNKVAFAFA